MARQITPDQALALSFSPFRYRQIKADRRGRTERDANGEIIYELADTQRFIKQSEVVHVIPRFMPGKTSTADYVAQFERLNNLKSTGSAAHLTRPAPVVEGPEVVLDTYAEDLV